MQSSTLDGVDVATPDDAPVPPQAPVRPWLAGTVEAVVSVGAAAALTVASVRVHVNPLNRIGQVSGLAQLQFLFTCAAIALLAVLVAGARWRTGRYHDLAIRVACAGLAGLTSGFVAGGLAVALHGTPWGLFAHFGDSGQMITWANGLSSGHGPPLNYPPVIVYVLAAAHLVTGLPAAYAWKFVQLGTLALTGPVAYLSWRLWLRPGWALGIGLTAALPLVQPYKAYEYLVLIALVPVLLRFLDAVRRSGAMPLRTVLLTGLGYGVALGALFQSYSGWYLWSAPGALGALLAYLPWRRGQRGSGLALVGITGAVFAVTASPHLLGIVKSSLLGSIRDSYFYFDTFTDPAYIAMWRDDRPGDVGPWPPIGELGGVGLFTVLLAIGAAAAIAIAGRRVLVAGTGALALGAWVLRFWVAGHMYGAHAVQLYPRTTAEILYCLLLLTGFAVYFGVTALRERFAVAGTASVVPLVGALCGLLLLFGSAASATADRYMPRNDDSAGSLAYTAQLTGLLDGRCPVYAPGGVCNH